VRRQRRMSVVAAPMAVASDGNIIVNTMQLGPDTRLDDALAQAKATGLPVFVAVAIPKSMKEQFVREIDDALADVVGRLGPRIARRR
jgi:hypothetical protein